MNEFDKIKIIIERCNLKTINKNRFYSEPEYNYETGQLIGENLKLIRYIKNPIGLSSLIIKNNECIMEIEGKLLNGINQNLISKNNIFEIFNILRKSNIIDFENEELLEKSKVIRLDCTKDLQVKSSQNCIRDLFFYHLEDRYSKRLYNVNDGVEFKRNVKTKKNQERVIFYRKGNLLRMEINMKTYNQIRNNFNSQVLSDVIYSEENINKKIFNKTFNPIKNNSIEKLSMHNLVTLMNNSKNLIEFKNIIYKHYLLNICSLDLKKIKILYKIKTNVRANLSYQLKKFKDNNSNLEGIMELDFENIEEIKRLLD